MDYSDLVKVYAQLEATTKKLEKRDIIAEFLKECPSDLLDVIALLIRGNIFPTWMEEELGLAENLMVKTVAKTAGVPEKEVKEKNREKGDIGSAVEALLKKKKQTTLATTKLTVKKVYENFKKIPEQTGSGSVEAKINIVAELLASANPDEGKYITRTVMSQMRVGVGEGILRDAIAKASNVPVDVVEHAYNLRNDMGEVVKIAKERGETGLKELSISLGRPLRPMLAQKVDSVETAIKDMGGKAAFETKYDGMRVQIHKKGDEIIVFTRRLDDVTKQFPDIVTPAKNCLKVDECIVEGEAVGTDPKTGRPQPFQQLSRRIKRKYDVGKIQKEIPVVTNLFDLLYLDGESWIQKPFEERRKKLEVIVREAKGKFQLAEQVITSTPDEAEKLYKKSLDEGHEGVMAKKLEASYTPGSRVRHMYKIKPEKESLDLVVIGAVWGEGRRTDWLGSFVLGARDPETGDFVEVGKVATGLSDKDLEMLTEMLKPKIVKEEINKVKLRPELVVEVGYEEIQKSPTYKSGFALRFPRVRRIREDKGVGDADTIERINKLYKAQSQS